MSNSKYFSAICFKHAVQSFEKKIKFKINQVVSQQPSPFPSSPCLHHISVCFPPQHHNRISTAAISLSVSLSQHTQALQPSYATLFPPSPTARLPRNLQSTTIFFLSQPSRAIRPYHPILITTTSCNLFPFFLQSHSSCRNSPYLSHQPPNITILFSILPIISLPNSRLPAASSILFHHLPDSCIFSHHPLLPSISTPNTTRHSSASFRPLHPAITTHPATPQTPRNSPEQLWFRPNATQLQQTHRPLHLHLFFSNYKHNSHYSSSPRSLLQFPSQFQISTPLLSLCNF